MNASISAGASQAAPLCRGARPAIGRSAPLRGALKPEVRVPSTSTRASDKEEIYIGFPKEDYGPKEGRKGRVIKDDPRRYPDRDALTGGWAGGEVGLWQFREANKEVIQEQLEKEQPKPKPTADPAPGQEKIYIGFGKDELKLKNSGAKGRYVYDVVTRYPNREDIGFIPGATGGFAGGERGVKSFVETGEIRLRKPGEPGGQPVSPVSIAFILLLAGGIGGIVLTNLFDFGSN